MTLVAVGSHAQLCDIDSVWVIETGSPLSPESTAGSQWDDYLPFSQSSFCRFLGTNGMRVNVCRRGGGEMTITRRVELRPDVCMETCWHSPENPTES